MTSPPPIHQARAVVFGGGISGLTAAHELADRGFSVTLYEAGSRLGGLARSSYGTAPPPASTMARTRLQPEDCTVQLAVGGAGGAILTAGSAGIGLWYTDSGKFLRVVGGPEPMLPPEVRALAMDRNARRIVYAESRSSAVQILDVRGAAGPTTLAAAHTAWVTAVAMSRNGNRLLTGDASGAVVLWRNEPAGFTPKGKWSAPGGPVLSLAVRNNGTGDVVRTDGAWAVEIAGGVLTALSTAPSGPTATAYLGDDPLTAVASGQVKLDGGIMGVTAYENASPIGEVTCVAGTPNGTFVGTGSTGGTVTIWSKSAPLDPLWNFEFAVPISTIAMAGNFAYVGSRRAGTYPNRIWQIDVRAGEIVREFEPSQTSMIAGEHGFRFFPSFYRHVTDTMQRTPDPTAHRRSVADNLVSTDRQGVALDDRFRTHVFNRNFDLSMAEVFRFLQGTLVSLGYNMRDIALFSLKTFEFLTSGPKRRRDYEKMSWWDFVDGPAYSPRFQRYLDDLPKVLVALDSRRADARTQGLVFVQLLQDQVSQGQNTDRTLNGPTSEAWFDKWQAWLEALGVEFVFDARLDQLVLKEGKGLAADDIEYAEVVVDGVAKPVLAPFMVMAVPARDAREIVEKTQAAHPWWTPCGDLWKLGHFPIDASFGPISGVQFFLRNEVKVLRGHVVYPDSDWALSSISQDQFWDPERRLRMRRDFDVRGQISVVVGAWDRPVSPAPSPRPSWWIDSAVVGKTAAELTNPDDLAREIWRQARLALDGRMAHPIRELTPRGNLPEPLYYHIDEFPQSPDDGYLLNLIGDWDRRPGTLQDDGTYAYDVSFDRLVAAGNHMKTHTRLSTMESANESARHAVNSLLAHVGFREDGATIFPLEDWELLEAMEFKHLDDILYDAGKPHFLQILRAFDSVAGMFPCDPDANIDKTEIPGAEPGPLQSLLDCAGVSATQLACGLGVTVDELVAADRYLRANPAPPPSDPAHVIGDEPPDGYKFWPFDRAPVAPMQFALQREMSAFLNRLARDDKDSAARSIFRQLDRDGDGAVAGEDVASVLDHVRVDIEARPPLRTVQLGQLAEALGSEDAFDAFVSHLDADPEAAPGAGDALLESLQEWVNRNVLGDLMDHILVRDRARDPWAGKRFVNGRRDRDTERPADARDHTQRSAPVASHEARGASQAFLEQLLSPSPFAFLFRR